MKNPINASFLRISIVIAVINFIVVLIAFNPSEWTWQLAFWMLPFLLCIALHVWVLWILPLYKHLRK